MIARTHVRTFLLAIGLATLAAPALACVCSPPQSEAEKNEIATRIATTSIAIVDVTQVAPMDFKAMRGETFSVAKVHLGSAPARFELARAFHREPDGNVSMGMTSCDEIPPPGRTTTVVLYATDTPGKFRFGGTCDQYFINEVPGAIGLVRAALGRPVERG